MILSILHDLETRSIVLTLAFPLADLDVHILMELSVGLDLCPDSRKHVIKLNKSLHSLQQTAHNWFELLKGSLEARGCGYQSTTDPCVFIGKNSIVLVYVDYCLIFSKKRIMMDLFAAVMALQFMFRWRLPL